jgi:hypothetical protein
LPKSKLLYSTGTLLGYRIAKKYYNDRHYVWAASNFGPSPLTTAACPSPATSTPRWRYKTIHDESRGLSASALPDSHGLYIDSQKSGILKGAGLKYSKGAISSGQLDEILYYVPRAEKTEYKPLLYVMVWDDEKHLAVADRAHPFYDEYIIEELPGDLMEVLDLDDL